MNVKTDGSAHRAQGDLQLARAVTLLSCCNRHFYTLVDFGQVLPTLPESLIDIHVTGLDMDGSLLFLSLSSPDEDTN